MKGKNFQKILKYNLHKDNNLILKKEVISLLNITEMQFNEMFFNSGLCFIEEHKNKFTDTTDLSSNKEFWDWFSMRYYALAEFFMRNIKREIEKNSFIKEDTIFMEITYNKTQKLNQIVEILDEDIIDYFNSKQSEIKPNNREKDLVKV